MKLASASLLLALAMATHGQRVSSDVKGRHSAPPSTKTRTDPGYVNGKILASYTSRESLRLINEHVNSQASFLGDGNVELESVNKFSRPQQANGGGDDADGGSGGISSIESDDPVLGYVVIKTDESNVRLEMDELASIPGVKHVERGLVKHINSKMPAGASDGDGRGLLQEEETPWGIDMVNVTHLWDIKPASHIKICVVDTGYDLGHVDLPAENVTGWNPSSDDPDIGVWDVDGNGHGTHVAGTIGAIGGNGKGVVGVNPDPTRFSFHIAKACDVSGDCEFVLEAVQSCVKEGANVISMSLGGPDYSEIEELVFQDVYDQDILVIAAAGNSGSDVMNYPAGYKTVVSVASVAEGDGEGSDTYGELSWFSTRNDQTEIAAPGSNVLSTIPGDGYDFYDGTSMACPHVSGIAALLWSHFPECKNNQIRNAMIHVESVREPPTTDDRNIPGWDKYYGWGIVNAGLAYELLRTEGCEGAGGINPDPDELSSIASGGSQQKSLGCVNDEQCFDAKQCLGQKMKCNVNVNTCYAEQDTIPDCNDGISCTMNVCSPLHEIVDGMNYMCANPDKCGNGFTCDVAGDQQCVCTTDIVVVVDIVTDDFPDETSYRLTNTCTGKEQFSKAGFDSGNTLYQDDYCLPDDAAYDFTIQDTFGDGICCDWGSGSYTVTYKEVEVASGGSFGYEETKSFGTCPPCDGDYVTVDLLTDDYPGETSYRLTNTCTGKEQFSKTRFGSPNTLYQDVYCVPDDAAYDFTIEDTAYDGICCDYGSGSYTVTYKGVEVASGGSFGYNETTSFGTCPPPTESPTPPPSSPPTESPTPSPSSKSKSGKATSSKSGKAPGASADGESVYLDYSMSMLLGDTGSMPLHLKNMSMLLGDTGSMSMLLSDTGSMPLHLKKVGEFGRRE